MFLHVADNVDRFPSVCGVGGRKQEWVRGEAHWGQLLKRTERRDDHDGE